MTWYDEWFPTDMKHWPLSIESDMDKGELRPQSLIVRALTRFTTFVLEERRIMENIQEQGNFLICTIIFLSTLTLVAVYTCIFNLNTEYEFVSYRRRINFTSDQADQVIQQKIDLLQGCVTSHITLSNGDVYSLDMEDVEETTLGIEQDKSEIEIIKYSISNSNTNNTSSEVTDLSE